MRARLVFLTTFGFAALAACGGGGGGGGTPVMHATPTPSPTPSNDDSRPATTGDAFSYAGTMSVAFVRPPQTYGVVPSPNPANTQTLSYTVVQNQSVTDAESYNGFTPAVGFSTAETDTLLGGLSTTSTSSTEFYAFEPAGTSTLVHDLGGSTTTEGGDTFTTLVGASNGVVDVLPEVAGPISVPADATLTLTEHDADGQADVRTTNADGTYTENITYPDTAFDNAMGTATANADGSGSFSFPVEAGLGNVVFAVGAPVAGSPAATIPITVTYPVGLFASPDASPTPTVVTGSVNVWYPQPPVFSTKTLVDAGQTSIPAACNVPSALQRSSSNAIVATSSTVDPVFGELDARTTTQYTEPGVGVACVQLQDVLQQYYDFSGQAGGYVQASSAPVQTTTTLETLGIASEKVIGLSSVARQAFVGASRARFSAMLDRKRARRHADVARILHASFASKAGGRI